MPFHRASRDTQRVGDLLVIESLDDETQNVQLARAEGGTVQLGGYAVSNAAWEVLVAGPNASDGIEQF